MRVKNNFIKKILFLMISAIIFLGYFILKGNGNQSIALAILSIFLFLISKSNKLKIHKNVKIQFLLLLIMAISALYSVDKKESVNYIICFCALTVFLLFLNNSKNIKDVAFKSLLFFSSIHVICTLLYPIFPSVIQKLALYVLPRSSYIYNVALYKYGCIAGICSEHGINSVFISVFIALVFSRLLFKRNLKNICLVILGFIALLLTGKRGPLLAMAIALVVTFIIYNKNNKKVVKNTIFVILVIAIILVIMNNIPSLSFVFSRFDELNESGNALNGREVFYDIMINNIKNNFVLGSGIRSTILLTGGNDGHNVYLQILSEIGIMGLITYMSLIIHNFVNTIKKKIDVYTITSLILQLFYIVYSFSGNPFYNISILALYIICSSNGFLGDDDDEKSRNTNIS